MYMLPTITLASHTVSCAVQTMLTYLQSHRNQASKYVSDFVSTAAATATRPGFHSGKNDELLSTMAPDQVRKASLFTLRTGSMDRAPA